MSTVLLDESIPKIAIITLNDPLQLNAMSEKMAGDFRTCIDSLKSKKNSLRAVILTGAGKAFSAGGDLQMLLAKTKLSPEENKKRMLDFYDSFLCMHQLSVPIIAAINGAAIGAGLCVASACDIRIASDSSKFGYTFTKLGLHPGMAATYFVPKITSYAVASELLITGRIIDAEKALKLGLVSDVVPSAQLMDKAKEIASEIMSTGSECVSQLLQSLRGNLKPLADSLDNESNNQAVNYNSKEFLEGVTSIIEKRKANF